MHRNYYCSAPFGRSAAPVNISETDDAYILQLFAPGLDKETISVTTQHDLLTIRHKAEKIADRRYTRREYEPDIYRSFDLKGKIAIDQIRARYHDGILTINLPKTDAARRPEEPVPVS